MLFLIVDEQQMSGADSLLLVSKLILNFDVKEMKVLEQ